MCWLLSLAGLMCWLLSRAGLICWLLSVAGRVNKENLRELMPILGLLTRVTFFRVVTDGFFSPIVLPMRVVLLELILILGLLLRVTLRVVVTGDFFSLMDLAIRTVLFELTRLLVRFPALELTLTDLLTLEGLEEDLRALEVTPGRTVVRLDVTLLDWRALGLTVALELLRLDGFEALTLLRDAVAREEAVDFVRAFLALEDCRALGAAEVFLAGWLF